MKLGFSNRNALHLKSIILNNPNSAYMHILWQIQISNKTLVCKTRVAFCYSASVVGMYILFFFSFFTETSALARKMILMGMCGCHIMELSRRNVLKHCRHHIVQLCRHHILQRRKTLVRYFLPQPTMKQRRSKYKNCICLLHFLPSSIHPYSHPTSSGSTVKMLI